MQCTEHNCTARQYMQPLFEDGTRALLQEPQHSQMDGIPLFGMQDERPGRAYGCTLRPMAAD